MKMGVIVVYLILCISQSADSASMKVPENWTEPTLQYDDVDSLIDDTFFTGNNSAENNTVLLNMTEEKEEEAEDDRDLLGLITEPIFFTTALVGNSLSIRVLLGKDYRKMTVSLTLICLAISDMIVTILHPWNRPFFRKLVGLDIRSMNGDVGCKVFYWVYKTSKMTSSWFVVFVSIERFLVVWCPLKVKILSTRRNAVLGLMTIYSVIGTYTAIWTFASGLKNGKTCVPDMKTKGTEELTRWFLLGGTTLYSGLPSLLMIIFTGLIVIKLGQSYFQRKKIAANATDKATVRVTTMLLGVTIAYIILVNPHSTLHNISYAVGKDFFETKDPALKTGRQIAQVMEQINYSINFFLYILCSSQFRRRTAQILGIRPCAVNSEQNPSTAVSQLNQSAIHTEDANTSNK